MNRSLRRDPDGRMRIEKDGKGDKNSKARVLTMALTIGVAAVVLTGIGFALAEGGQVQHNYQQNLGEDGMYEENNNNPFLDDEFPGDAEQKRGGVVWPD